MTRSVDRRKKNKKTVPFSLTRPPPPHQIRRARPCAHPITCVSVDAGSEVAAAAHGGSDVAFVSIASGATLAAPAPPFPATHVALPPDHAAARGGGRYAVGGPDGRVAIVSKAWLAVPRRGGGGSGATSLLARGGRGPVLSLAWGPADLLAWATPTGVVLHDVASGGTLDAAPRPRFAGPPTARCVLRFGPPPSLASPPFASDAATSPTTTLDLAIAWGRTLQCLRVAPGLGDVPSIVGGVSPPRVLVASPSDRAAVAGGAPYGRGGVLAAVGGEPPSAMLLLCGGGGGGGGGGGARGGDATAVPLPPAAADGEDAPLLLAAALPPDAGSVRPPPLPASPARPARLTVDGAPAAGSAASTPAASPQRPPPPPRGAPATAAAVASTATAAAAAGASAATAAAAVGASAAAALAARLRSRSGGGAAAAPPPAAPADPPSPNARPPLPPTDATFFIARGRSLALVRVLAGDALVEWLLSAGRAADAAAAAAATGSARTRARAADAALGALLAAGDGEGAAAAAPGLLRDDGGAWERAVHAFAAARALAPLAPRLPTTPTPTGSLPLPLDCYTMALRALLLRSGDHPAFLAALRAWPPAAVDSAKLAAAAAARASAPGGATPALLDAVATLYSTLGTPQAALGVLLAARSPGVASFVEAHGLFTSLDAVGLRALVDASPDRAVALLTAQWRAVPAADVLGALLEAESGNGSRRPPTTTTTAARTSAAAAYVRALLAGPDGDAALEDRGAATAAVGLLADFAPAELPPFLERNPNYDLTAAASLCQSRGLHAARAAVLARGGDDVAALTALVADAKDVPSAVALARARAGGRGGELWDTLVALACRDGEAAAALLDAGGATTAPKLVAALPAGLDVPRLAPRLAAACARRGGTRRPGRRRGRPGGARRQRGVGGAVCRGEAGGGRGAGGGGGRGGRGGDPRRRWRRGRGAHPQAAAAGCCCCCVGPGAAAVGGAEVGGGAPRGRVVERGREGACNNKSVQRR